MFNFYADGTWVLYPDQTLLILEVLTFTIEILVGLIVNKGMIPKERQWTFMEIFFLIFLINLVSFGALIPLALWWKM